MGNNLELRPNDRDFVMTVVNTYVRKYGSGLPFLSLGYGGETTITIGREKFTPTVGSPQRPVKSRTVGQSFRAACQLKANLDRQIIGASHAGITEALGVTRTFHKDDPVAIDLSVGPAFSAAVIEGNVTAEADVTLYDPAGNVGVLNTDYSVTPGTGTIEALTAAFQDVCTISYDYTALANELTYGGLAGCASEDELEVKLVCRSTECRLDEEDFVQHVFHIFKAETEGDFELILKPDTIDPVSITFNALEDPTKAKGSRLFAYYHEIKAA